VYEVAKNKLRVPLKRSFSLGSKGPLITTEVKGKIEVNSGIVDKAAEKVEEVTETPP